MTDNTPSPIDPADLPFNREPRWQDFVEAAPSRPTPPPVCTRATKRQGTSYMAFRETVPIEADDPLLAFTPVPHKQLRRNSIGPERQQAFIAHLAATGIVTHAARAIGASMEALYKLRRREGAEEFDAAWNAAVDRGVARLEDTALARAIEGAEVPIVSAGKMLGTYRKHNEALVMFLLRHRRPARYGLDVQPGHPLYERIREEVLAGIKQDDRTESEVIASIDAKLEKFRQRKDAAQRLLGRDGGEVFG